MEKFIIYQKPTCSTCRNLITILKDKEIEYISLNYYEKPFTHAALKSLLAKLRMRPREILRTKEPVYKKLGLAKKELSDDALINCIIRYPDLMQRPIVVAGNKAVVARPAETIHAWLSIMKFFV